MELSASIIPERQTIHKRPQAAVSTVPHSPGSGFAAALLPDQHGHFCAGCGKSMKEPLGGAGGASPLFIRIEKNDHAMFSGCFVAEWFPGQTFIGLSQFLRTLHRIEILFDVPAGLLAIDSV